MKKSPSMPPDNINTLLKQAITCFQQGRLAEADPLLQQIVRSNPTHADANHLLGLIAGQQGQHELACRLISCAIKKNPRNPAYHLNYSLALIRCNRLKEALGACDRTLKLNPDIPEAHIRRGNLLRDFSRLREAESAYRNAIRLQPSNARTHFNLGNVLQARGQQDQALICYRKAVSLEPGFAEAHSNLGEMLRIQGMLDQAIEHYQTALQLMPEFAEAYNNLGVAYIAQEKRQLAIDSYRKALAIEPDHADALYNLGSMLKDMGEKSEAIDYYQKALLLRPDFARVHWALAVAQLPVYYGHHDDPDAACSDFSRELDTLGDWLNAHMDESTFQSVGSHTPFYLAYQERNNRDLLSRFGTLCTDVMEKWRNAHNIRLPGATAQQPLRIGIVSAQIYNHSVWIAIVKGWLKHLDRERFTLHIFSSGTRQDEETRWAQEQADSFDQGSRNFHEWVDVIQRVQPDVLIYPEIGMDPLTIKLASLRLAPVQVGSWGHPETTGLPTIDYYLSAEALEPSGAQEYYTEQLVLLPNLGCCYTPSPVTTTEPNLAEMGISPDTPLLLCPGSAFKYTPWHDKVFVEIAQRLKECQLVFFTHQINELSEKLHKRLASIFATADLNFDDYGVFIPWQNKEAFYGLMQRADVFLDTLGFSGFNTAMQAVECGLPIVTCEGHFLRSRLASGILQRMGLRQLVTENEEDYITLAVKLAQDSEYRQEIQQQIRSNRHTLFEDLAPVRALEDFLENAVNTRPHY